MPLHLSQQLSKCLIAVVLLGFIQGCGNPTPSTKKKRKTSVTKRKEETLSFSELVPSAKLFKGIEKVLSLNTEESQKVSQQQKKQEELIINWHSTRGKELKKIKKKAFSAAKKKSLSEFREMEKDGTKSLHRTLVAEQRKLLKDYENAMFASVPAEKLDHLKAHQIKLLLLEYIEPLNIDAKQKEELNESALKVVRGLGKEKNWRGYGTSKLEKIFGNSIILDRQKVQFESLKKKNKMRMLRWNNS